MQTGAPAQGVTYAYDALNRLALRTMTSGATTTTLCIHDLDDHIIAEINIAGVTPGEMCGSTIYPSPSSAAARPRRGPTGDR
ncbi:hypothetical protein [Methylocystis sp.]|uniref:hypothetical protein n=1 Tax=Methylocystis sp. TaxID=1911079 RepID=UPI003DA5B375